MIYFVLHHVDSPKSHEKIHAIKIDMDIPRGVHNELKARYILVNVPYHFSQEVAQYLCIK